MGLQCKLIIEQLETDFPCLYISKELFIINQEGSLFPFYFGNDLEYVRMFQFTGNSSSPLILYQTKRYSSMTFPCINLKITPGKSLHAGPVIGVVTDCKQKDEYGLSLGVMDTFCKEFSQWVETCGGLLFLIHLKDLDQSRLRGYSYNDDQKMWLPSIIPLPAILYNRIHSRKKDREAQISLESFTKNGVIVFNQSFLSKMEVYDQLFSSASLHRYLPYTNRFTFSELKEKIGVYGDLFIKHKAGSQGRNLIRIRKIASSFSIVQNSFSTERKINCSNWNEVEELLDKWCRPRSAYLIQETIPLSTYQGQSIDFRFLCHFIRNEWKVTSTVARISGKDEFVSNLSRGGRIEKPLVLLSSLFKGNQVLETYKRMKELAIASCETLYNKSHLSFGELGIDIGIDHLGNPWVIEINSKPSKQNYHETNGIRPSVKALYQVCKQKWLERSDGEI
ncbi:glutathione synthase/RimK-type ligase-like ATP-grasp enzyme [Bacillus pakistanensis]|uniref:Glutathione synthase/RimK-type ligase-like ATP-grasp enzyme n=1 Tax=Rossellomorea pakistanensis TaxID=992288 RepID=A0ABS2NEX4_9BACI|nr:YheC/YheD family protein [Bacillus pakistanensis]MBM7586408.1 glutathione synthase/RimK-type ligase-like ATP-grasp enzyme [Bacillus pakistanensis]